MEDDFRGRVFAVYDTLFNVTYVVALVAAAFLLPPSGRSPAVLVAVAAVYLATAGLYWSGVRERGKRSPLTPLAP